jgi:cytochrome P450
MYVYCKLSFSKLFIISYMHVSKMLLSYNYLGYLIPKGWKVMPLFRNIHHNPEFYPAPHSFDPSRFEVNIQ